MRHTRTIEQKAADATERAGTLIGRLTRGKRPAPRRTFVYGVHGVGKTSFAAGAPGAVFLPTEDGTRDLECVRFPLIRSFEEMLRALGELYREEHPFRTVVVDSLDWFEHLVWERLCRDHGVSAIEDFDYRTGYFRAVDYWRRFLDGLEALRSGRSMAAVLIAHSRIERFEAPDTGSYDRYVPRIHRLAAELVEEWADEVFFASWKIRTRTLEEGVHRERRSESVATTGERVLKTTERPAHRAKNRLGMPDEIPLSWAEYADFLTATAGVSSRDRS